VFRSDAAELFPEDHDVRRLRGQTVTLAELLTERSPGYRPPAFAETVPAVAQVHCHQHAVLGWEADRELLRRAGVEVEQLDSGCCGLAGNFGFEAGHLDVSEACAERVLLPRLREIDPGTVVLADGFSCRTQIHELDSGGREGMHLAELLAAAHEATAPGEAPEGRYAARPAVPGPVAKAGAVTVAGMAVAAAVVRLLCRH
jgi:Fe-S oxidoreductase